MSVLKPGTLCVVIAGCPENIGLVVEVIKRLGRCGHCRDAYGVKTVTGRPFKQLWDGDDLVRGYSDRGITDRHKLRPMVGGKDDADYEDEAIEQTNVLAGQ